METSVHNLELLLQKTESDLDSLGIKVDKEFKTISDTEGETAEAVPSDLVENVQELRAEFNKISADIIEINNEMQNVACVIKNNFATVCEQLEELQQNVQKS